MYISYVKMKRANILLTNIVNSLQLLSATLYAVSNVTEEYLVKRCTTAEFLSRAGFWGSIICGVQA